MDYFFYSFLSTDDSYHTKNNRFRVGVSTIHNAGTETCDAIWEVLSEEEMPVSSREDWI